MPKKSAKAPKKSVKAPKKSVKAPKKSVNVPKKKSVKAPKKSVNVPKKKSVKASKKKSVNVPMNKVQIQGMKFEVVGRCQNGKCVFMKKRTPINPSMLRY